MNPARTPLVPAAIVATSIAACVSHVERTPRVTASPSIAPEPRPPPPARSSSPVHRAPLAGFDGASVVLGLPPAARVTAVAEGGCALTATGEVWCWRDGGGDAGGVAPRLVEGLGAVRAIDSGCAFGDRVRCLSGEDAVAPGIPDARAVSLGMGFGCALRATGSVTCWGDTSAGQLGTADPSGRAGVAGVRDAIKLSAGSFGACAVERSGTLVCWGAASLIPWAPGGERYRPPAPTPTTALRGVHDVVDVSVRGNSRCLVRRTGRLLCWETEDDATLLPHNPLPAGSEIAGIDDAASLHRDLVIRRSGRLAGVTFEIDERGELRRRVRAIGEGALPSVVDADGDLEHGCAVVVGGTVVCWRGS